MFSLFFFLITTFWNYYDGQKSFGKKNVGGIQIAVLCPVLNDNVQADVSLI